MPFDDQNTLEICIECGLAAAFFLLGLLAAEWIRWPHSSRSRTAAGEELLHLLARRDAERICDRFYAWLPPSQQNDLVRALTRIARNGLKSHRDTYQRLLRRTAGRKCLPGACSSGVSPQCRDGAS
jgi:hypothetical protein